MTTQYDKRDEKGKKQNPFLPIVGFILLVGLGGFSYAVAPTARHFLETTRFRPSGINILPMAFPTDWPDPAVNAAVALAIFVILFGLAMLIALMLAPTRRAEDTAAKWVEEEAKRRKKERGY